MTYILQTQSISKSYRLGNRELTVLRNVSLAIEPGEFVAVVGSSGSGKSTLLSLMSGLDSPTNGRIFIHNRDITDLSEDELAPLRNATIGYVFQSFHLVPSLSAIENIMFPAELQGDPHARAKAEHLLQRVGLLDRADNFPHQLSGGEKQRVAICRALINNPQLIFADEPTGNLDTANGQAILDLLRQLQRERQTTLVLVTHDPAIATTANRIIQLQDGEVVAT